MNRILACVLLSLIVGNAAIASAAEDWQARDYNLSMAGALVNDHCERNWQGGEYISIHACKYQLANLYNLDTSAGHFAECTELAGGDIVMIADCMVGRFTAWLVQEQQQGNSL